MSARFLFVCTTSIAALLFAKSVFAEGAYQRTEDRKKTFVWNNDPQPNDAASWSGERDQDGYASGAGTLKWFKVGKNFTTGSNIAARKKTEISSYTGTMVRGKFKGQVVTVDHGKTYHANFVDGRRKGIWVEGPVIAKAESAEEAASAEKAESKTDSATVDARGEPKAEEKPRESAESQETTDIPAAGPTEEKTEVQAGKVASRESNTQKKPLAAQETSQPLVTQASSEQSDEGATSREPVNQKGALAPGAVRAIERPTKSTAKKSETQTSAPLARSKKTEEKTEKNSASAKPAPSQPAVAETNIAEDVPAEGPPTEKKEEKVQSPKSNPHRAPAESSQPSAKETPVDDSIRALTGPPSALRSGAAAETTNPPIDAAKAETAAAPATAATPKLTAVNAMDIADIEARTRGYDLGEYQLPKAEYNSSNDTWSVTYAPREADTKQLNVAIQDKNGKAEIKK